MATSSTLGLLFEINADPSKAGQSAGSMPVLAPGRNVTGLPPRVTLVVVGADAGARADIAAQLNQHVQYEGGRLNAPHSGSGQRL